MNEESWPIARFGTVARLRALAAALPGVVIDERTLEAPYERVWEYFADMERSIPEFDVQVRGFRIVDRDGNRLRAQARAALPVWVNLDVELEAGWCWMVMRPALYVVGFAAESAGGRTRFAHLEGYTVPGPTRLQALVRPVLTASRRLHRAHVPGDVDGIERALGLRR